MIINLTFGMWIFLCLKFYLIFIKFAIEYNYWMSDIDKYTIFLPLFAGLYICSSALSIIAPFYPLVA